MQKSESKPTAKTTTKTTRKRAKGLGDTIEQITEATGIKAVVDWFSEATGVDCGCDARKEKLNKIMPYGKVECLTRDEYDWLTTFYAENPRTLNADQKKQIAAIHARIFNHVMFVPCTCSPKKWMAYINELRAVWLEYERAK